MPPGQCVKCAPPQPHGSATASPRGVLAPTTAEPGVSRSSSFTELWVQPCLCIFVPMGTKGDLLPLLYGAMSWVADGGEVLFLAQPCFAPLVGERLAGISWLELIDESWYAAVESCSRYRFERRDGVPYLEKEAEDGGQVRFRMNKAAYQSTCGRGKLTFVCPQPAKFSRRSFNDADYRVQFSATMVGSSFGPRYGEFLGAWQACLSCLRKKECPYGDLFVTSFSCRASLVAPFEEAMGIVSDLVVRLGSLCLADHPIYFPRFYYAMSATLAPKEMHFPSLVRYPHPDIRKQGVLSQPDLISKPTDLPDEVAVFLQTMPTIVVTVSSFGAVDHLPVGEMFPASDKFQVLFLGSSRDNDPNPRHMHYKHMVSLDAAFREAALIVHGCGVGTTNQVALSGKPSIGLSGFLEQESNGSALEKLGISKHFTIKSLHSEESAVKEFASIVLAFFEDMASFCEPSRLEEVQRAVRQEEALAHLAFCNRLRQLFGS